MESREVYYAVFESFDSAGARGKGTFEWYTSQKISRIQDIQEMERHIAAIDGRPDVKIVIVNYIHLRTDVISEKG